MVIHGMGEQRPVETLNRFSRVITPKGMTFYSKVDRLTDSFEARRHLIPPQPGLGTQTEIYEYHWAQLMQGNKINDLVPLLRRMLLPVPGWWGAPLTLFSVIAAFVLLVSLLDPRHLAISGLIQILLGLLAAVGIVFVIRFVPVGLIVLWLLLWIGIGLITWAAVWGPAKGVLNNFKVPNAVKAVVSGGTTAAIITYLISRALPNWLTSSFVDVVRYLDTSPRSYDVRKQIRAGVIDLLRALHEYGRYQRIVIIAHSLGSYIGYDAISYLWAEMAKLHRGPFLRGGAAGGCTGGEQPGGLSKLEEAASTLNGDLATVDAYQTAQRALWTGLRLDGNPWLITDFISFGSPMYFAQTLYTRNKAQFDERVAKQELATCPPVNEMKSCNNVNNQKRFFSWNNGGRRVLHDAAPFAVVRWTNLWYPSVAGFFGDWFGGRLSPLFGNGVKDIPVTGNKPHRWAPGAAHALYLGFPDDYGEGSFNSVLSQVLEINAASWFPDVSNTPDHNPETRLGINDPDD